MQRPTLLELILAFSLFLFIILTVLHYVSFDRSFYEESFESYGVYDSYGKGLVDLEFEKVLVYLEGSESLESSFFSERDKLHLVDVKNLFETARALILVSFLVLLFTLSYLLYKRNFVSSLKGVLFASAFVLLFFVCLSLLAFINFDATFTAFHKLLFRNDLWLLDPAVDNLINLLPLEIFIDITERFVLFSVAIIGFLGLGSFLLLRKF